MHSSTHCRRRVWGRVGVIAITLLSHTTGLKADPISINQVAQIIRSNHTAPDLRLRALIQNSPIAAVISSSAKGASIKKSEASSPDSLFAGALFQGDQKPTNVVVVSQGDVSGTICDCGEILLAGGGFPKWPLLFLGAIPFFFLDHDSSPVVATTAPTFPITTPTVTSIPPSTPPSGGPAIPEPASVILFGPS